VRIATSYRRPAICCHYPEYELIGAPEVRVVPEDKLALSAAHLARGWSPQELPASAGTKARSSRGT
jgi:hypothetical protein